MLVYTISFTHFKQKLAPTVNKIVHEVDEVLIKLLS